MNLETLRTRIKELESENAKLSAQLSNCSCQETKEKGNGSVAKNGVLDGHGKKENKLRDLGYGAMMHHSKRYVALKVMYFGARFYGFASEAQMDPTVEGELFKALERTRLIFGDRKELQYSRCGRTDKGVSSVGQVIALFLRSNHRESRGDDKYSEEISIEESCGTQIDYFPGILGALMTKPVQLFEQGVQVLLLAGKLEYNSVYKADQLMIMKIKGSAFLWHQIRCMVAVLFLIGQGLESPNVLDALLDIERTPWKPQFPVAPEIPLVLQSCEFEGLKSICSSDTKQALNEHLERECRSYQLQSAIFHEALLNSSCVEIALYEERRKKLDAGAGMPR
ncbi:hypothetical protein RND71_027990 [Anisodus tanguticus]|uniref:tRNA pseudouridine synthase n=1 Tax=Anisodus tanguticus TaxID=243964 RepID=A0AAE1RKN9_9SOLA|nr:hypothetical protein RND71_027990 [Anisodus tanguticus]